MKTKITLFVALCVLLSLNTAAQTNWSSMLVETWTGTQWQNQFRQTNMFDDNNFVVSTLGESWVIPSSEWQNAVQTNYTNNPSGTVQQATTLLWNASTESWDNSSRTTNTYNASDNVTHALQEIWLGSWMNSSQTDNTYDSNGYLTGTMSQNWSFFGGTWVNTTQSSYQNNVLGNPTVVTNQSWSGNAWANQTRQTHHYDEMPDQLSAIDTEVWDGDSWMISHIDYFVYDANGYVIQTFMQNWSGGTWVDDSRALITNDPAGNPVEIINQTWNVDANIWENQSRITFNNNLGLDAVTATSANLFPNPAASFITIKSESNLLGQAYQICDERGRAILSGTLQADQTTLDVNALHSGLYFVRIGSLGAIKMIKQ